jgi:nucleoside-diphosphate-sugar epimerase
MTGRKTEYDERYLLTGATGFLGSHIMAGLLLKGKTVVVAGRSSYSESLKQRIRKLLNWFGIEHLEKLLEFYEIDLLNKQLGLAEEEYKNLCSRGLSIIHCASDTSFAEKNRERVMKSNVESLTEILNFALKSRSQWFHFISSAYAAGCDIIECREVLRNSSHFTNVYEESKARAESKVSEICKKGVVPYTIIRPSIVYGDSVTGRSLKFNALYFPVKCVQYIRDIYIDDIKINNGVKSAECGIYINNKGFLHLPIRIFIPNRGNINLIPVNYFLKTVLSIIENPVPETVYHITSNNPLNMAKLTSYTERYLKITGIEILIGPPGSNEVRNPPEELLDHFIKPYLPYISDKRIFIRENTDMAVCGSLPPDLTYEIFQRCMDFAVSADWGEKLL